MLLLSALTTEYVKVPISAAEAGVSVNPIADSVQMAFVRAGSSPVSGDWKAASWEQDTSTTPTTLYVRALVGPTGVITLASGGPYDIYIKVLDNPETVVRRAGALAIL